jgi:hypothetical protein
MSGSPVETVVGLLLVFVLPGFAIGRATFPEWRFRGPDALLKVVETAALSLALSVGVTVLLGFGLLNLPGTGFAATWSNPQLEILLAAMTAIALAVAWVRGAFRSEPPAAPALEPLGGEDNAWETLRQVEALSREQRRLRHSLRHSPDPREAERLRSEIDRVGGEIDLLRAGREAEYAR